MRPLALLLLAAVAFASAPAAARVLEPAHQRVEAPVRVAVLVPPPKHPPRRRPAPDRRTRPVVRKASPATAGLAAAAGAGGAALIGGSAVGISALVLLGAFGTPTLPVTVTAAVVAIAVGLATPILVGIAGGGAVLLMDPRTKPGEWSSLMQCATSGCCVGFDLVGGTVLGGVCGNAAPQLPGGKIPGVPGPDQPAEWTAAAGIGGFLSGAVIGGLLGWSVAPAPDNPWVPITVGAIGGSVLGAAVLAGAGAGLAEVVRR